MPSFFELVVQKMSELGFYNFFFPFVLSSVLFYALLRKSKLFGEGREGEILNGIISLVVAFLIFGYPVLVGFTFGSQLSTFFTQLTIMGLLFVLALAFASMFHPDFPKFLTEQFVRRTQIYIFIALAVGLFVTSGLVGVFTQGLTEKSPEEGGSPSAPRDVILILAGIIIFIIVIIIAAGTMRSV